jgi:general secretion pathway protein D
VITWLPEGASLTAQGVISADGRHVRMSLMPFFSTIGPVDTFNFATGETRRYDP